MTGRPASRILGLSRAGWIGFFVLGFVLTCASAASAYWSIPVGFATGNHAVAEADTLSSPTAATATANGSNAITVGWSLPGTQLPGAQYRVTRTGGPGSVKVVCTVTVAPTSTTESCQDAGLTAGTAYDYSVVAVIGDRWQSPAVSATATTLGVTTTTLPSGSVGASYATSLSAVGGNGSYTWALTSGTLPAGVTLNAATGAITGTPTAAGLASGLAFRVTDGQGHTATSEPLTLSIAKGSTQTTVTPSVTTLTYGAESAATFAVTVRTANNAVVTSGSVTVSVGSATCTVTLPASSCSIGDVALPAGGPYSVSATFPGNANLTGSTGTGTAVTVNRAPATVILTVTGTPVVYGAETNLEFTAVVAGGNGVGIPDGLPVVVTKDSTPLCTMTLTSGSGTCRPLSGTVLPAGSNTVTATFNASGSGSDTNFVTTANGTTTVVVSPAIATVSTFSVAPNTAVFGAATSLVFTATVSTSNGVAIPTGSTVVVTQGSTPLCIIPLTAGTGTCSPASGTVLPAAVAPYTVTASFNAAPGDPNFTTATATTTITIQPNAIEGIEWELVSTTGTLNCDFTTNPRAVTCTATGVGNKGSFQARVKLVGANRTPFTNTTSANIQVSQTTTGTGGATTPTGPLLIAPGASTTAGSYTLTLNAGNPPPTTITASINVGGVTYTVNCAVSR